MNQLFSSLFALALLSGALSGCTLAIGSLAECTTDAQCASQGEGLVCREQMCVYDPDAECRDDGACVEKKGPGATCKGGECVSPFTQACSKVIGTSTGNPIWLGAALPMTTVTNGSTVPGNGVSRTQAMQLALTDLNKAGGVAGRPFAMRVCDTQGNADKAKAMAEYLVWSGAAAIVTGGSAETLAVSNVTVPAGVLLMSVSATSPQIGDLDDHDLVWRTAPSDAFQGQVIARELKNPRGDRTGVVDRVAVIELKDQYGAGLSKVFRNAFKDDAHGAERFLYDRGGAGIDQALSGAASYAPSLALAIGFPDDVIKIASGMQSRPELSSVPLFLTDAAKNAALLAAVTPGSLLLSARGTAPGTPSGDTYENFVTLYTQTFQANPRDLSFTAHSYDAAYCLALAAQWAAGADDKGAITGAAMAEGLKHLSEGAPASNTTLESTSISNLMRAMKQHQNTNITGASGSLDFDPVLGEPPGNVELWSIERDPLGGYKFKVDAVVKPEDLASP